MKIGTAAGEVLGQLAKVQKALKTINKVASEVRK
jgi:hypothetical protein